MRRAHAAVLLLALTRCTFDASGLSVVDASGGRDAAALDLPSPDASSHDVPPQDAVGDKSPLDAGKCVPRTRKLTIAAGKVVGGPHASFPLLVSLSGSWLKTQAKGGRVAHNKGYDISFSSSATGSPKLAHELERYASAAGTLVAWVRVPSLTASTVIYLRYGDCSITAPQENAAGVWDATFKGVWHLSELVTDEAATGLHLDSTSHKVTCGQSGNDDHAAMIYRGQLFDGSDNLDCGVNKIPDATYHTITAWVKPDLSAGDTYFAVLLDVVITKPWYGIGLYIRRSDGAVGHHVGGAWRFSQTNKLASNKWSYVALRGYRHPGAGKVEVSVNGSSWEQVYSGQTGSLQIDTSAPLHIGSFEAAVGHRLRGIIDEARVSSAYRAVGWIQTEHNNQLSPGTFLVVGAETP